MRPPRQPAGVLRQRTGRARPPRWWRSGIVAAVIAVAVVPVGTALRPSSRPLDAAPRRGVAVSWASTGVEAPASPGAVTRRVLVVGDSLAETLVPGLLGVAGAHGVELSSRAFGGCGLLTGVPLDRTGQPYPWSQACNDSRPGWQAQAVQDARPDVVMWLGAAWDERDRLVDGTDAQIGTVAGDRIFLQLIDESAQRLTSTGARLVIVTAAPERGSQLAADPERKPRLAALNRLLRLYAVFHQIQVVDLAPIVCPRVGPECPETVNGVVMRPDGYHLGASAAPVVAGQVLPSVLAGSGPAGMDANVAAGTFASLDQRLPSTSMWSEVSHPWRTLAG